MIGPALSAASTTPAVATATTPAMRTILENMCPPPIRSRLETPLRITATSGTPGWFGRASVTRRRLTRRAHASRAIYHGHRARFIRRCADECELGALREQRLAGTERCRTHVEAVLVYEVVPDEGLGGPNASVQQQVVPRLALELRAPPYEIIIAVDE